MARVLLVDDEPNIVELATMYLEKEGFQVEVATNGRACLEAVEARRPDIVVLDLMLPEMDGLEVCRKLRQRHDDIPIVMLTARSDDVDKIVGLELGADDYVTKPFNPRELAARIKAVLRRYAAGERRTRTTSLGPLLIDLERREATVDTRRLQLRTKEFDLLAALARNPGIVMTREQLLEVVWGFDFYGESRTVDVHVNHLRDKLAGGAIVIETVRGVGYRLLVQEGA